MIVRVRNRGAEPAWGSGPTRVVVDTITIGDRCPRCDGPRGNPENLNQHDDGCWYSTDLWDNPCGHKDTYTSVLDEAGSTGRLNRQIR
jgi:hypothetical protein